MAVNQLAFDSDTAKRVTWEAWEFRDVGPHLVEVTNASYGYQKEDHTYTVGVEVRDGLALPAECDCPADIHRDPDCKHKAREWRESIRHGRTSTPARMYFKKSEHNDHS